jgi:sugar phosphate isomerase/epimerase
MWTRRGFLEAGTAGAAAAVLRPWNALLAAGAGSAPPIGVCRSADEGPALAAGGAAYVEVSCRGWLKPDEPRDAFEPALAKLRSAAVPALAANSFLPGGLKSVGPDANHARTIAYAAVAFRRAEEAGIRIITFGSGASRAIPDGYARADAELQFVALLARMGPIAAQHGVTVCVEPLQKRETNMINRVSEAQRLVSAVGHPSIGITADFFHMLRENEGAGSIRAAGPLIRHLHVAEKRERTAPGNDGDDFRPYLEALDAIGYDGLMSIECRWRDLPAELPRAIETLRTQSRGLFDES